MNNRIQNYFVYSAAVILFVAALANLFNATGSNTLDKFLLDQEDPLSFLSCRQVFLLIGALQLLVFAYLLMGRSLWIKLILANWLPSGLLIYRLSFRWMGETNACEYLGGLSERFFISPRVYDGIMFAVLGWLLVGSFGLLMAQWLVRPKPANIPPASADKAQPSLEGASNHKQF